MLTSTMNPIDNIRNFINSSKFYCPIRHSNPLSQGEYDDIKSYMKDLIGDLSLEEIIYTLKDDTDLYISLRNLVIKSLCNREVVKLEREILDTFNERSSDPISFPVIIFTPITCHSLTLEQIPEIIAKVKNTINISDIRLPQLVNILDDTKFYLVDSFPDNIVEIYWFELNEGANFYINSFESITQETTPMRNYCTICCKINNNGYMFYSNIPDNNIPYTMIISKDFNELCNHIPVEYHHRYNYPLAPAPATTQAPYAHEFKTALELYNSNMNTFDADLDTLTYIQPYINDNLPFQTDPKINMLYLIAKHSIQFSTPDNSAIINTLIEWILNNTPLLIEIKAHPSYNSWMIAIERSNIPLEDGMFISRYHLFKYLDYKQFGL